MYRSVTNGVQITVEPRFVEEESDPNRAYYFWAYTVEILNLRADRVHLRSRHWKIISDDGRMQEVRGPGVVGEEPELAPGESFEYTSGAPLPTPSGVMSGSYGMEDAAGSTFDVAIPAFSLDSPHGERTLN
ncbi:MAG: Co2+/Mg2+ efflux protein ApaG [Pseudomonadota bacterium]